MPEAPQPNSVKDWNFLISQMAIEEGQGLFRVMPCAKPVPTEDALCKYVQPGGCAEKGVGGPFYEGGGVVVCPIQLGPLRVEGHTNGSAKA